MKTVSCIIIYIACPACKRSSTLRFSFVLNAAYSEIIYKILIFFQRIKFFQILLYLLQFKFVSILKELWMFG